MIFFLQNIMFCFIFFHVWVVSYIKVILCFHFNSSDSVYLTWFCCRDFQWLQSLSWFHQKVKILSCCMKHNLSCKFNNVHSLYVIHCLDNSSQSASERVNERMVEWAREREQACRRKKEEEEEERIRITNSLMLTKRFR